MRFENLGIKSLKSSEGKNDYPGISGPPGEIDEYKVDQETALIMAVINSNLNTAMQDLITIAIKFAEETGNWIPLGFRLGLNENEFGISFSEFVVLSAIPARF